MKNLLSLHKKNMASVNLDALIKREDLYKSESDATEMAFTEISYLRIDADLIPTAHFFRSLRKADFQRITSEWKPERVAGLIKSFINGDIIPACILWSWNGCSFIIDGGHRLSALIAWINNDYGDGEISKAYFGDNIPKEQQNNARKTKDLIDNNLEIGSFKKHKLAMESHQEGQNPDYIKASNILVQRGIQVQWIKAKTSQEAEMAFFKINGEATPIDETEAIILKSRKKPNGIAARAIIHGGSAHKYWKDFKPEIQKQIEEIAIKINSLLFEPPLDTSSIRFPCAGKDYSNQSTEIVFGIVNMINGLDDINLKRKNFLKKEAGEILPEADLTGVETTKYLEKVKRVISIISGTGKEAISLGLSPLVYFYSPRGRFQITSFLSMVSIALQWDKERRENKSDVFQKFCAIRGQFEDFLLEYKDFISQATFNIGSGIKSYKRLADLFLFIIDELLLCHSKKDILESIQKNPQFGFIKIIKSENEYEKERNKPGKRIPKESKTEIAIKTFLNARILCPICNGHATFDSYNIDHIKEKRNNGDASIQNLDIVHTYCNEEKDLINKYKMEIKKAE
jgi:hypothetical protein